MKKLLIFTLAVASAAAASAATFKWTNGAPINQAGTSDPLTSGTVYLIDGADGHGGISRDALWAMVVSGATIDLGSYTWYSATLDTDGKGFTGVTCSETLIAGFMPSSKSLVEANNGAATLGVVQEGNTGHVYAKEPSTPGGASLEYGSAITSGSFYEVVVVDGNWYFSEEIPKDGIAGGLGETLLAFENADNSLTLGGSIDTDGGWYKVQAIPEPTSGLLMLVGLGLLGLRRRRNRE